MTLFNKSKKYFKSIQSSFTKFEPNKFWNNRGKSFYKNNPYSEKDYKDQEQLILSYLKNLDFTTVLEVGCGYGRITKLINQNFEIKNYLATELSPDLVKIATEVNQEFQNIEFKQSTIQDLDIDKKYDLVIGTEVLQHVLPNDIQSSVQKLVDISKKHVINVDISFEKTPPNLARHNFAHDYNKIYSQCASVKKITTKKLGLLNHTLFHIEK